MSIGGYDDIEELYYDAVRSITLLVAQAGGEITITNATVVDLPRTAVLSRWVNNDGSITYRVVYEGEEYP